MQRPTTREEVLARLRKTVSDGSIIVGAGAGKNAHAQNHVLPKRPKIHNRHWTLRKGR